MDIEKRGVGLLEATIASSDYLQPYIDKNDRTPSWDGNIFVYDDTLAKKSAFVGKIPVQVKSTKVKKFSTIIVSYPYEVSDIRNYCKDGGVILFVVEITTSEYKIFYNCLNYLDLKVIIEKLKNKDQKTTKVKLMPLDINLSVLENECRDFIANKDMLLRTVYSPLRIEDAKEFTIIFSPLKTTSIEEYLFSHQFSMYGRQNSGEAERFITKVNFNSLARKFDLPVVVNYKQYYSSYELLLSKDGREFLFGEKQNISIKIEGKKIHYELMGTINEQLHDISFLLDLFNSKITFLGEGSIEILSIEGKEILVDQLTNTEKKLKEIQTLLHLFNISSSLDFQSMVDIDYRMLDLLIGRFIYNKTYNNVPFALGFNDIKIGNLYFGILVLKIEEDKGYFINNVDGDIKKNQIKIVTSSSEEFFVSPFTLLKKNFLIHIENLEISDALEDIKRFPNSENYYNMVTLFGLELIKAYDETKRDVFLEIAKDIFIWHQSTKEMDMIGRINELQIIRRQRVFTQAEKMELMNMRRQSNDDNRLLCGINILLENKADTEFHLDQLSEDIKAEFIEYPLYSLARLLGNL